MPPEVDEGNDEHWAAGDRSCTSMMAGARAAANAASLTRWKTGRRACPRWRKRDGLSAAAPFACLGTTSESGNAILRTHEANNDTTSENASRAVVYHDPTQSDAASVPLGKRFKSI